MAGIGLVVIVFFIAIPALMIWALIDLLQRPAQQWTDSGQDRLVWTLVVVLVGFVGPILYLTIGRSKLNSSGQIDGTLPAL